MNVPMNIATLTVYSQVNYEKYAEIKEIARNGNKEDVMNYVRNYVENEFEIAMKKSYFLENVLLDYASLINYYQIAETFIEVFKK